MKNGTLLFLMGTLLFSSCAVQQTYKPQRKFGPAALQQDYAIFRASLEEAHPSLYWYTPKDSMDFYFDVGKSKLKDSLTEGQFRTVLSYVLAKIKCGHTTARSSKAASRAPTPQNAPFPLYIKAWPDTVVVTANVSRKDSNITRGVLLKSIEGRPINFIIDSLSSYLSADGNNTTHKYQTLSNGNSFRNLYASVFGLRQRMAIEYVDTLGQLKKATLQLVVPRVDSPLSNLATPPKQPSRSERRRLIREANRSLVIDTALNTAVMEVNTFAKGAGLRSFFRRTFKDIRKKNIKNLVVDLRGNGGGSVVLSNLLTKYIADAPFGIADSLYAVRRSGAFGKYRSGRFFNGLFLLFLTKKRAGNHYHFYPFEGKKFRPRKQHHFEGTTYIITGGNTFSAASLVAATLKVQNDVVIVGEETGGGAYGNTAWLIPDVELPRTGVRFRLPLFRLVIDKEAEKGRGVTPEVPALPTWKAIRQGADYKMDKVNELIRSGGMKK